VLLRIYFYQIHLHSFKILILNPLYSLYTQVGHFFDRSVKIAQAIKKETGPKIKDFKEALKSGPGKYGEITKLKEDVVAFAKKFPTVGF